MDKKKVAEKVYKEIVLRYPKSAKTYAAFISDLAQFYSTDEPLQLSFSQIKIFINNQRKIAKKPANTINVIYSAIKLFFNDIHSKNYPFDQIGIPKKERPNFDILSIEEIKTILEKSENNKVKTVIALLYGCGLEAGEILNAKYTDINVAKNIITVRGNRRNTSREAYIPSSLIKIINAYYKEYKPKNWLFEGRNAGEKLSARSLQNYMLKASSNLGSHKKVSTAILRYTYVNHTVKMGVSLPEVLKSLCIDHRENYQFYSTVGIKTFEKVSASPWDLLDKKEANISSNLIDIFWEILNPKIKSLAFEKFKNNFYADSIETCLKELNSRIKKIVKEKVNKEYDGSDLMNRAFAPKDPIIILADLKSETGQNVQKGYLQIYSGVMTGIRNPKAHSNIILTKEEAIHYLFLMSHLFNVLDESILAATNSAQA